MPTAMTGRERVNCMFQRRDHDRVPRHDTYWPETIERWQREGFDGDHEAALEILGSDFYSVGGSWPTPFPGRHETVTEDDQTETFVNDWGETVRYWKHKSGTPEHIGFGCDTPRMWETRYKPAYIDLQLQVDATGIQRQYAQGRRLGKWCFLTALESFESTRHLMGDEIAMFAMADDPEWVMDVTRTYTDAVLGGLDAHLATGIEPDGLWIYGDMAYNHATMCSPAMYRQIIWPDHKRLADWGHEHGMKVIFHTDGDVNGVMDLYLAAGFDCLQPLESKANMDIRKLCPKYGGEIAFFGNIDVMILGSNDRDRIENEVRTKLEAGKACKGYAYHSDHSVPPFVSWSTYRYLIKLLDHYGRYDSDVALPTGPLDTGRG